MEQQDELHHQFIKPPKSETKTTSLPRTIISLLLFLMIYFWLFKDWMIVMILVLVLLVHESGHFIAMKAFGYKGVNMTFVPFVGAYVSGETSNLSSRNKLIVLLAGPVPGVIVGTILLLMHHQQQNHLLFLFAIIFLVQNLFNLLPVFPLDGGQFFQTLFFNGSRVIQLVFLYLSIAILVYLFFLLGHSWGLLLIAVLLLLRIAAINMAHKVRRQLDEKGIDYACSYDDLTDEEYWEIRNAVIVSKKVLAKKYSTYEAAADEQELIKHVEAVLRPSFVEDLAPASKFLFLLVWIVTFVAPVIIWLWHKGIL